MIKQALVMIIKLMVIKLRGKRRLRKLVVLEDMVIVIVVTFTHLLGSHLPIIRAM